MPQPLHMHGQMLTFPPYVRLDDLRHLIHHTGQAERVFRKTDAAGFYL